MACKKCEKSIEDLRLFRDEVLQSQSTLSENADPDLNEEDKTETLNEPQPTIPNVQIIEFSDPEPQCEPVYVELTANCPDLEVESLDDEMQVLSNDNSQVKKYSRQLRSNRKRPSEESPLTRDPPKTPSNNQMDILNETLSTPKYIQVDQIAFEKQMLQMGLLNCSLCNETHKTIKDLNQHFRDAHDCYG